MPGSRSSGGNRGRGGSSGGTGWAVGPVPLSSGASSLQSTRTKSDLNSLYGPGPVCANSPSHSLATAYLSSSCCGYDRSALQVLADAFVATPYSHHTYLRLWTVQRLVRTGPRDDRFERQHTCFVSKVPRTPALGANIALLMHPTLRCTSRTDTQSSSHMLLAEAQDTHFSLTHNTTVYKSQTSATSFSNINPQSIPLLPATCKYPHHHSVLPLLLI